MIGPVYRADMTPPRVPTPRFAPGMPASAAYQSLAGILRAAGEGRTDVAQVGRVARNLAALPLAPLREVAARLGILPPPATAAESIRAIRTTLLRRLAEANRLRAYVGPARSLPAPSCRLGAIAGNRLAE
jgi:hypothetical protein